MSDASSLGTRIHDLRKALGMSQEHMARQLDVSLSTVNRWEQNHVVPSQMARHALRELAKKYELSDPFIIVERSPE